jgi:hypothetical protein
MVAGWALRFQPSPDAIAWRRGAARERRTARLLSPLERHGWVVLHDLPVPGGRANLDHLVIGPGGVFVIDSKQYRGPATAGRPWEAVAWPISPRPPLRAVSWEADQAAQVLPNPGWPWCPSWPSTAPRSPGARLFPTACGSCRPGACQ